MFVDAGPCRRRMVPEGLYSIFRKEMTPMQLPTQAEVNAASRHVASFAGGAILAFGLSTKIDPDTVKSIITATGNMVNDIILLVGLVAPVVAGYFAKKTASPDSQAQATAE